jgi:hypothetical protein
VSVLSAAFGRTAAPPKVRSPSKPPWIARQRRHPNWLVVVRLVDRSTQIN